MAKVIQEVEKLQYKTIEMPKLTRGIAKDSTELTLDAGGLINNVNNSRKTNRQGQLDKIQ